MSDDIVDNDYESDIEEDDVSDIDEVELEEGDEEPEGVAFLEEEEEGPEEEQDDDLEDNIDDLDDDENNMLNVGNYHKFEIVSKDKSYERLETKKRISTPFMTPQELTKLIGIRSQQIASGMMPMIDIDPDIRDTKFIAIREIQNRKMPLIVRRYFPNGYYEDWRAEELILPKNILF